VTSGIPITQPRSGSYIKGRVKHPFPAEEAHTNVALIRVSLGITNSPEPLGHSLMVIRRGN
jgi:hypothetical protein